MSSSLIQTDLNSTHNVKFISDSFNITLTPRKDGYLNATVMCKAGNKLFADYIRLDSTKEFIRAYIKEFKKELNVVDSDMGYPITTLVNSKKGGKNQGTWIHPELAIDLARWISPKFAVKVIRIVHKYASNDLTLIQDIVEKNNKETNTVSNILIASNPDDLKTVVLQKTTDRDDLVSRELYIKLQTHVDDLIKQITEKDKIILVKDDKIDQLMKKVDEISAQNKNILCKNETLTKHVAFLNQNIGDLNNNVVSLTDDVEVLNGTIDGLDQDVEILNQNVDKITVKLDIATDDGVVGTNNDKDTHLYGLYTNNNRTEYRSVRRQKRSINVAKWRGMVST